MTTDKTPATLATAKPGGCVQLPTSERERFEAWAESSGEGLSRWPDGLYVRQATQVAWDAWQAALAARQPVEVSEGAFRAAASRQTASAESNATAESLIAFARQSEGRIVGWQHCGENHEHMVISDSRKKALKEGETEKGIRKIDAAYSIPLVRQPVGGPVAVVGADFDLFWIGSGPIAPLVERNGLRPGSKLYSAPPAQAVDLGRARASIQSLLNWIDDWAETPEESGIDAIEAEAEAVLALIDGKAEVSRG